MFLKGYKKQGCSRGRSQHLPKEVVMTLGAQLFISTVCDITDLEVERGKTKRFLTFVDFLDWQAD